MEEERKEAVRTLLSQLMHYHPEEPIYKAIELAVDALRHQIPTKIMWFSLSPEDFVSRCPSCKRTIRKSTNENVCSGCGKAISWLER